MRTNARTGAFDRLCTMHRKAIRYSVLMPNIHAREVDPKLLAIFDAVFLERSATRAADRLGITQSTVSHALARLRDLFKDELFTRSPRGLKPSPRAMELGPRIHRALAELQAAVSWEEFEPKHTTRAFTILLTLYGCHVLAPGIAARFRMEAPNARLHIRYAERPLLVELDEGHADAAIGVARPVPTEITAEAIFEDDWVAVVRPELANGVKDASELEHLPHIALMPGKGLAHSDEFGDSTSWRFKQGQAGINLPAPLRNSAASLRVPETAAGITIVRWLDAVALVPRRLAEALGEPVGLKILALPQKKRLQFALYSLKRSGGDPATDWMLDLIKRTATEPNIQR